MFIGILLIAISYSGIAATGYAFMAECFPVQYRYSGSAVSYNIAQALLGGTQPLISLFLIKLTGSILVPALYLMFLSAFCFLVIVFSKRSTLNVREPSHIYKLLKEEEIFLPTLNVTGSVTKILDPFCEEFTDFAAQCSLPVADLGVGYGFTTQRALEKGATVIANDLEPKHLEILLKQLSEEYKTRISFKVGAIPGDIHFTENSLGAVLASRFLHFLSGEMIELTLSNVYKWLAPGGKLFVVTETPYLGNLRSFIPMYESRKKQNDPWPGIIDNFDVYFPEQPTPQFGNLLDPEILERVFKKAGFIVEKTHYISRPYYPEGVRLDGRESVGIIGRKD